MEVWVRLLHFFDKFESIRRRRGRVVLITRSDCGDDKGNSQPIDCTILRSTDRPAIGAATTFGGVSIVSHVILVGHFGICSRLQLPTLSQKTMNR